MQCVLYYFHKYDDWEKLEKHINKIPEPCQIITDNFAINEFLKNIGKNSTTLRSIFPEEGDNTYNIYRKSKQIQKTYADSLKDLTFDNYPIFQGFENMLLDHIILVEKARTILEKKQNTIFIFEGFSSCYFSIMKVASAIGYESGPHIGRIHGNKIIKIRDQESALLQYQNAINYLIIEHFPQLKIKNVFSFNGLRIIIANLISRIKREGIHKQELAGIFMFMIRVIRFKMSMLLNIDLKNEIINIINKKISETDAKHDATCAFFCTTNKEDLYLKPIYPLVNKLLNEKTKFHIFTVDFQTSMVLRKKRISFLDMFQEIQLLTRWIGKTKQYKELLINLKETAIKNNLSLIDDNDHFSSDLLSEIRHSLAITTICEHIIKQIKLKSIVVAADGTMFGNCATMIAKKHGITSFSVPAVVINGNPLHADWYKADKICVYGLQGLDILSELGYSRDRLVLTGNPKYDNARQNNIEQSKKALEENYNIDRKRKLIVIGMARWHPRDEEWMSNIIKFANRNDFEVAIKIHPMYKTMLNAESEARIKKIRLSCWEQKFLISYDLDLNTLISASDLVITDYSNVGVDAVLYDKPLITVNFAKEDLTHEQRYHEYDAAIYVENYSEIENLIKEILLENKYDNRLSENRKKMKQYYNFYDDNQSSQRIFDLLIGNKEIMPVKNN